MNFFRRALVSISRRKMKSFILFFIILILGNIMLSSRVIVQSVDNTRESILAGLPPVVSLVADYEEIDRMIHSLDDEEFEIPWLTFADLTRVKEAGSAYIKSYDYSSTWFLETDSLESFMVEEAERFLEQAGRFTFQGVESPAFTLLEVGDAAIIEGRTFTREEIERGKPVIIIGKGLAGVNNLTAGDMVTIETVYSDYTDSGEQKIIGSLAYDFEVIGILDYKELPAGDTAMGFDNRGWILEEQNRNIYTSNALIAEFMRESREIMRPYYEEIHGEGYMDWYDINPLAGIPVTYVLKSSAVVADFTGTALDALDNDVYQFVTQEDNYKKIARPLETMSVVLTYTFYITMASSILVLTLVLIGFMRDRKQEIGIYLALGEKKTAIAGQMVVETILVTLAGATVALMTGMFFASFISELAMGTAMMDEYAYFMQESMTSGLAGINFNSVLESYKNEVRLSSFAAAAFFVAVMVTAMVSQLISSVYILRSDPKKIMM